MRERATNAYGLRCLFLNDSWAWHDGDGEPVCDVRKATMPANRGYLLFSSDNGKLHKAYVEKDFDTDKPQAAFIIVSAELMDKQEAATDPEGGEYAA